MEKYSKRLVGICLFLVLTLFTICSGFASESAKFTSGKIISDTDLPLILESGTVIKYDGNSTLHPFSATATDADFYLKISSPEANLLATQFTKAIDAIVKGNKVKTLKVTIPVKSLKSGEGALDGNMYNTLKAKDFDTITYQLQTAKVSNYNAKTKVYSLKTTGNLTIAGKTNPIDMNVTLTQLSNGKIEIAGEKQVLLKDYNIEPPTIMFVIKVFNEFQVKFKLLLGVNVSVPQKEGAAQ